MKNRRLEKYRRQAQQYHRNRCDDHFEQGILLRYHYDNLADNALSRSDTVEFISGKTRIVVEWQHPRQVYCTLIQDAAIQAANEQCSSIDNDWFKNSRALYKKAGRNRKKIRGYEVIHCSERREWLEAVHARRILLSREAMFTVRPSFSITMMQWCRVVQIVAPVEIRNITELSHLVSLVRRIMKSETTLAKEFPDYVYDQRQWLEEGLADLSE